MTQKQLFSFLSNTFGQANVLTIPTLLLKRLNGNHSAALFLSQLAYWTDKTKNGWIFKTYEDWEAELFLKEKKVRAIKNELEALGIIETKIKQINGAPVLHYRIKQKQFIEFLTTEKKEDKTTPDTAEMAETIPPKRPDGNGQNGGNDTAETAETIPPNEAELFSNIDYSKDYNIDYTHNPPQSAAENNAPNKKTKKTPLRAREPVNDFEKVEKEYLRLWDMLYSQSLVKTKNPLINWTQARCLLKKHLTTIGFDDLIKALNAAKDDAFILEGGFSLTMILSNNILNRLINAHLKTPEQKQTLYRRSAIIPSDKIKQGDYL